MTRGREQARQPVKWALGSLLSCWLAVAFAGPAIPTAAQTAKIVDQILALVDGDIITRTDLIWNIALDPKGPSPDGPLSSDLLARELDITIQQRLIAHEAERLPSAEVTQEEVNKRRGEWIGQFSSEAAFRKRVESVGITPEKLDDLIRQSIIMDRFIDFRFRSFVFVTEQDIKRYYDDVFTRQMREKGAVAPPLDATLPDNGGTVRDMIAKILKAEKIEQETERWLTDATQRAEVVRLAEP